MSRTTSFGPSVSIRPSKLARAVNVNTPSNYTQRLFSVTEQPHNRVSLGRTVNVNTPAPAAGGNISPVTGCPAGQISIADTCVAIPTYSTPASNSPAAAMQTIQDKICAVWPNLPASSVQDIRDKICAENPEACKPYPINERGLPIAAKIAKRYSNAPQRQENTV